MVTAAEVDVEQELASLCGGLNASYARLVAIVAQALADQSWAGGGIRSPEHWLTLRAGLSPFRARAVLTVARRAGELPTVMDQFAAGQLSLDQVAVVARYAPAHVEASVAEFAVHASVPQLRRALSRYSFDPPAETSQTEQNQQAQQASTGDAQTGGAQAGDSAQAGDAECPDTEAGDTEAGDTGVGETAAGDTGTGDTAAGDTAAGETGTGETAAGETGAGGSGTWNGFALPDERGTAPAQLSMSYDEQGRFTLRFSAPADLGALVEAALKEAKDALFRAGRPQVSMADALVEIARRSLGAVESINRRDAYRTYVHLDTGGGWLTGRPRLPQQITDKLTCDGILQPVWHTDGAPVNVGRAQRIVPTRTRRLVEDRDRGCRFPGCAATTHVECHHLIHWTDGGPTDTTNLASLCSYHHDTHHDGEFTITGDADDPAGLTFTTRGGFPIRPGPTLTTPTIPTFTTPTDPPPQPPGSPGSLEPSRPPAPPPPTATYRGPTGDTLNLRWVTFHEPRESAYF